MSLVLQISDTHFGTERPVAVAALQALCEAQRPQVLLVTGDITQRARPREFAAAKACFDALPVPTRLVLPGSAPRSMGAAAAAARPEDGAAAPGVDRAEAQA